MSLTLAHTFGARRRLVAVMALVVTAWTTQLLAHRVVGQRSPTTHTALVQSPTASPVDLPVSLFNTGLSVICFRVTNTSTTNSRITAIGLELPGDPSGFSLVTPVAQGLSLFEDIDQVPGFPGVTLDFAVVARQSFNGERLGLPPNAPPVMICVGGPFNPTVPIETLLNGVFVAFEGPAGAGNAFDIGVWERR